MCVPSLSRFAAAILLCGAAHVASAHSIDMFAHVVGDEIHGLVTYSDGAPVAGATVEVSWDPPVIVHEGEGHADEVQTDGEGKFVFKPVEDAEHLFICRTDDGHRAAFSVAYGDVERGGSVQPPDERVASSIEKQIGALQEQIHELERRTQIRDIAGGIGYILGLAGIVALVKSRKRAA